MSLDVEWFNSAGTVIFEATVSLDLAFCWLNFLSKDYINYHYYTSGEKSNKIIYSDQNIKTTTKPRTKSWKRYNFFTPQQSSKFGKTDEARERGTDLGQE